MEKINRHFRLLVVVAVLCLCSCTKYNYIDTGLAIGDHNCSMWEYLGSDKYNWDSTRIMIEHAGLRDVFEGNSEYGQITFFGITNKSIMLYMFYHNDELDELKKKGEQVDADRYWNRVKDIPSEVCRKMLMQLIIPRRLLMADIPSGNLVTETTGVASDKEIGGKVFQTLGGGELFLYTFRESYKGIAEKGENRIYMVSHSMEKRTSHPVASCNIKTLNGVVHSLEDDFLLTDI